MIRSSVLCMLVLLSTTGCRRRAPKSAYGAAPITAARLIPLPPPMPPPEPGFAFSRLPPPPPMPAPDPRAAAAPPILHRSNQWISVSYGHALPNHRELEAWLNRERPLDRRAMQVAQLVAWPRQITWRVEECDRNAFWSARTSSLTICYRFFDFLSREVPAQDVAGVLDFTLMHEVGHSLVSEFSLPVVGNEENAADLFAATVLLAGARGDAGLFPAIRYFQRMSTRYVTTPWDEHRSDGQRYYDLLCLSWGAGAMQAEFARLLPEERRVRCQSEYSLGWTAWDELLRPHARTRGGVTFWPR